MKQDLTYDRRLRAIGQALEQYRVITFSLKSEGDAYFVQGEAEKVKSVLSLLRRQKAFDRMSFSSRDIDRLDQEGRAKRKTPDRLPDFRSLSSMLRTIGAYLDLNQGRLLEVCKRDETVIILFQNSEGHPQLEERTTAFLSDLAVHFYRKRQKRNRS
jgi:hypothetical protein